MAHDGQAPGSARLQLAGGAPLLRPEEQVAAAMLEGWRVQQLARNLAFATIEKRLAAIGAFSRHADAFPWAWSAQMLDEWLGDLRAVGGLRRSTIRNYALAVSAFCRYLTDPAYGWAEQCQVRFGSHPVPVCHEWKCATRRWCAVRRR
jgi:integrase/recombinase XerC